MNLAVGRLEESGDQPQRRGLAAAGWAQQADQLPPIDPQRDLIDDRDRSEAFCQAAQINGRISSSTLYVLWGIRALLVVDQLAQKMAGRKGARHAQALPGSPRQSVVGSVLDVPI